MADNVRRHNTREFQIYTLITRFLATHTSSAGAVPFMNSVLYKSRTYFPV